MRRRSFLTLLGGAAAAWPMAAGAQQPALPVIGILGSPTAQSRAYVWPHFQQGLQEMGFVEGQNVVIEPHWANDEYDRLPELAADLVRRRVSLIVTSGNYLPIRAAKNATTTIPIVFSMGADPVQLGLVASLNRPGGNITGATVLASDSIQKRLQLLHDLVPNVKVFGLLVNPDNLSRTSSAALTAVELVENAVRVWGGTLHVEHSRRVADFDTAFASLIQKGVGAMITSSDALFGSDRERLVALAAQYAIPMIHATTVAAQAGGLMGYTASISDNYHQVGRYAGRILKGEKPADLPVLLPTKFEFVINLKTARTLGLDIPPGLLAIADEVIE